MAMTSLPRRGARSVSFGFPEVFVTFPMERSPFAVFHGLAAQYAVIYVLPPLLPPALQLLLTVTHF